ncbi:MAG: B12-binding domain-containing radical SAM protein [Desulfamplus sp.]|nr:B12-binding domain-containing radical SAM protein [Desulfamplus sp.]
MKIMLWKPGVPDGSTGELPHIGLGILANDIRNCGHDVFIADHHFFPVEEHVPVEIIEREKPDILCISIASPEWKLQKTQKMVDFAYQNGIPVWVGGPHVYSYWDILQNDPRLSKIVVGESDGRFQAIWENKERVIFLGRADNFLLPDFSCLMNSDKMVTYPVFTSRGCSHNCAFCAGTKTHGNRWRPASLDKEFWNMLDNVKTAYPFVKNISVIDDEFTSNLRHSKTFLKRFIDNYKYFNLSVFNVRADQIDDELLVLLKMAGVENLSIGIESGDPEVFRMVRKGETHETIRRAIEKIQHAGIIPRLNMVIGLPGDSPQAHKRSMDWVTSIPMPRITQWLHYAPYRGTWAYNYFVEHGDIEDGFIPGLQHGGYDQLPEKGTFDAKGFSMEAKMLAQLEGYLRCYSPILILNHETIKGICQQNMMMDLYDDWYKNAPIQDYVSRFLPGKMAKGQVSSVFAANLIQ